MNEITFLMDSDTGGFFTEAEAYFTARDSTIDKPTGGRPTTLEDVLKSLRARARTDEVYDVVNLVAHGTAFSAVQFPISEQRRTDDGGITTLDQLKNAVKKAGGDGYPAVLGPPAVTAATKVCLYGCDVGRDALFCSLLGQLFGPEVTVYAPLRMAVFRHTAAGPEHRLARSWSTAYTRDVTTATDWPATRTAVGALLKARFPSAATDIQTAIASATDVLGPTYFWSGRMDVAGDPTGITVSSAVLPAGTVDDTTVPLTLTAPDFHESGGVWTAWVATLGQVLEEPVSLENPSQYRKVVLSAARLPAKKELVVEREPTPVPELPDPDPDPLEDDMANYGKYRGEVVDDLGDGRLRVTVPALTLDDLIAEACLPPVPKSLLVWPEVGAEVWVEFEGGDVTHPIWTGALVAVENPMDLTLESVSSLTIRSGGTITLEGPVTTVESALTNAHGQVHCQALVADAMVTSPAYTPGAGNVW